MACPPTPSSSTAARPLGRLRRRYAMGYAPPLAHAGVVIADWKQDYNTRRRHSSLGYQAPAVYAAACTHR